MHDIDRTFLEMQSFEFGPQDETATDGEVFDENELQDLAAELLSVSNEQELDYFLGNLIKKAAKAVGKVVRSPLGQQLGGLLKGVAKKALPMAGAALGNWIAPGVGGAIGSRLASSAGSMLGLELEGLSQEDAENELAKQYVRIAGDAIKNALTNPNSAVANPAAAAKTAVVQAMQKHAPTYLQNGGASGASGKWVRRGNRIVLYGV